MWLFGVSNLVSVPALDVSAKLVPCPNIQAPWSGSTYHHKNRTLSGVDFSSIACPMRPGLLPVAQTSGQSGNGRDPDVN